MAGAFTATDDFEPAILAAVCGQLAGACCGLGGIPERWVERLAMRDTITDLARRLVRMREIEDLSRPADVGV